MAKQTISRQCSLLRACEMAAAAPAASAFAAAEGALAQVSSASWACTPLERAAVAARLILQGLGAVGRPDALQELPLRAAIAGLTLCAGSNDALPEGGGMALEEVAYLAYIGLAAVLLPQGKLGDSFAALKLATHHTKALEADSSGLWLAQSIVHVLRYRRCREPGLALSALELMQPAVHQQADSGGCQGAALLAARVKPWVLLHRAASHLALGEWSLARAAADRAAEAEAPQAEGRLTASLRLLLRALCREAAACSDRAGDAIVAAATAAALAYVNTKGLPRKDLFCAGRELAAHGLKEAAANLYRSLRGNLAGGKLEDAEFEHELYSEELSLWATEAELNAQVSGHVSVEELLQLPLPRSGAGHFAKAADVVGAHLWNLACRTLHSERADLASRWLQILQEREPKTLFPISLAFSVCYWCSGKVTDAQACAGNACAQHPSHGAAHVMLLLTGAAGGQGCSALPAAAVGAICRAAAAGPLQPPSPLVLEAAVLRLRSAQATRQEPLEDAVDGMLQLASAICRGTVSTLDKGLQVFEALSAVSRELCASGTEVHQRTTRKVFEFFWNVGIAFGREERWPLCAAAFERAHHAAAAASGGGAWGMTGAVPQGLQAAEEAQMCLVARMAALSEDARCGAANATSERLSASELHGRVAAAGGAARALCEQVQRLRKSQLGEHAAGSGGDKALPLVVLMEFESRVAMGDNTLNVFLCNMANASAIPAKCYLMMALLALQAGSRDAAMQSLRFYLGQVADILSRGPGEPIAVFAMALRELVALHGSRDDSLGCFEEVLGLLRNLQWLPQAYPPSELQWLCTVAWGNAVYHSKAGQGGDWVQRWVATALGLLDFCPALAPYRAQMADAQRCCLQKGPAAAP